jgi:uncharacterized protein (UPF0335 family)
MAEATDDRFRLLIERIERLEEEKQGIADDIRDVYSEAKAVGYDPKIMRQVVRLRKMTPNDRSEMDAILETYTRFAWLPIRTIDGTWVWLERVHRVRMRFGRRL